MAATVVIASQAWQDLSEVIDYIARDNLSAAADFGEALLSAAVALGNAPGIGCRIAGFPTARMIVYRRYLIFYSFYDAQNRVVVLRFWHSARDLGDLQINV